MFLKTHGQKTVSPGAAHGVEGAGVRGALEILELKFPVVVDQPPFQRLASQLLGLPYFDYVRVTAGGENKKYHL
jgi:hypothetical protein